MQEDNLLQDESLGQKLIKKGFRLYLFSYIAAPAGYITRMLMSNSLSVEDIGILYSIVGLVGILNVYNDFGLTEALNYFLPRYRIKKKRDYTKTAILMSLFVQIATALLIILVLWVMAPWLAQNYFHSDSALLVLRYFCFYFLGINLFQTFQTIFNSFQDTFNQSLIYVIKQWATVIFTFSFFITGNGTLENYSLNRIFGLVISILISVFIFAKKYSSILTNGKIVFEKTMQKEYRKYAIAVMVSNNVITALAGLDQQIVLGVLGAKTAGFYANYQSLIGMHTVIVMPIVSLLFPLFSELVIKKQSDKIKILQNVLYTYFFVISLSLGGLFFALGPEISLVLFGEKFVFSGELLQYGSFLLGLGTLGLINFYFLSGMGKLRERIKINVIGIVVYVVCNFVFINIIGIYGSILAALLYNLLVLILSIRIINKSYKITVQYKFVIKNALIISLLSVIILMFKNILLVNQNSMRYQNFFYILLIFSGYYLCLLICNYRKLLLIKNEIINLKK